MTEVRHGDVEIGEANRSVAVTDAGTEAFEQHFGSPRPDRDPPYPRTGRSR